MRRRTPVVKEPKVPANGPVLVSCSIWEGSWYVNERMNRDDERCMVSEICPLEDEDE